MRENIIVFGGDGFCGWPTALHLSNVGYRVIIVDNLSRRKIDEKLGYNSLTPIKTIKERIIRWEEETSKKIEFINIDISKDFKELVALFIKYKPKAIVHFAEQRSAPYSMMSSATKRYTVNNNINATHNIVCALVESGRQNTHLVHLGTAGVYGYGTAGLKIPEGYLTVRVDTPKGEKEISILYPANPGSVYHMTKTQDALTFFYYNKNDKLRITDLHQGIVWGTNTEETLLHEDLINRFDYDGEYGTVLNRFLMQAAIGHPLTVYGTGGQTRAFIHIRDTVQCIRLAIENPPVAGDRVMIFNQVTECLNLKTLAEKVSNLTGADITFCENPRNEDPENDLEFDNTSFLKLGLNPITLENGLMQEVVDIATKYKHRVDTSNILSTTRWIAKKDSDD